MLTLVLSGLMLRSGLRQGQKVEARSAQQGASCSNIIGGASVGDRIIGGDDTIASSSSFRRLSASGGRLSASGGRLSASWGARRKSSQFGSAVITGGGESLGLLEADAAQRGDDGTILMLKSDVDPGRPEALQPQMIGVGEAGGEDEEAIALLVVRR